MILTKQLLDDLLIELRAALPLPSNRIQIESVIDADWDGQAMIMIKDSDLDPVAYQQGVIGFSRNIEIWALADTRNAVYDLLKTCALAMDKTSVGSAIAGTMAIGREVGGIKISNAYLGVRVYTIYTKSL